MILIMAFAIYKAAYKRRINKRLAEGREADIKPMMSPVKFVMITLLGAIIGMILIWIISGAIMIKQKKDMIVYPSVHYYRDNILEDSLYAGYKFGDEIKGYNRFSKQYGDVKLEIYITKYSFDAFPHILIASDYVGDEQNVMFSEGIKYPFSNETWGNDICPDSLFVIDFGGYKGKFKFSHNVYYRRDVENFLNEEPDESYELDFRIHESGSIACPQLGLTVS
jgi:hypothetical protein